MLIDVHAHIYPDAIAMKAARSIGTFYSKPVAGSGTLAELLKQGQIAGIDRHVIHSAAVLPHQAQTINRFMARVALEHPDRVIAFGTCHPDDPKLQETLDCLLESGLKGVKLHPDFQRYFLDDPCAIRMFEMLHERNIPAIIHIGDDRYPYSSPECMLRALDHVPGLRVMCAHLGGWTEWREGWKMLAGIDGVWADCSSSLFALSPQEAVRIIRRYRAKNVCFGTDYPMWRPADEVKRFSLLPLTDEERQWVSYKSFAAFIGEEIV